MLGVWQIVFRLPAGAWDLPFVQIVQAACGHHLAPYPVGNEESFTGADAAGACVL
jgi:hypothetical protein